jgi:hypothetical protein
MRAVQILLLEEAVQQFISGPSHASFFAKLLFLRRWKLRVLLFFLSGEQ